MGHSVCDLPNEFSNKCLIISRLGETDGWRIWIARTKMSEEQLVFIQTSNNSQQVKLSIKQRKIVLNTGREYKL